MPPRTIQEIIEAERPRSRAERTLKILHLTLPLLVTAAGLAVLWFVSGFGAVQRLVGYGVVSFFALGKLLILKGITDRVFGPFELAALVLYMDVAAAFFLVFNLDHVYRIRGFGGRLERLQESGREMLAGHPWMGKLTFTGVALFVMFPLTGTGAIGGSLFGRLLGMRKYEILLAIFAGSAAGCFGIALLADRVAAILPEPVRESILFDAIGIGLVVLLVALLWYRSWKIEKER